MSENYSTSMTPAMASRWVDNVNMRVAMGKTVEDSCVLAADAEMTRLFNEGSRLRAELETVKAENARLVSEVNTAHSEIAGHEEELQHALTAAEERARVAEERKRLWVQAWDSLATVTMKYQTGLRLKLKDENAANMLLLRRIGELESKLTASEEALRTALRERDGAMERIEALQHDSLIIQEKTVAIAVKNAEAENTRLKAEMRGMVRYRKVQQLLEEAIDHSHYLATKLHVERIVGIFEYLADRASRASRKEGNPHA